MITIQLNKKNYECYEYIDVDYVGAEEINNELRDLRRVLEDLDADCGMQNVSYQLVVYQADEIDAFVKRVDSEYILGISKGTFVELRRWFNMIFSYSKTYDVFGLEREKGNFFSCYTYRKALEFLVLHEYTHMKNGHCDIPDNEAKLIFEQSNTISKEKALFSQTLEFDADNWAAAYCVVKIMGENISGEEKQEKLKLLMFSIYTIFKKFSEYDNYDFDTFMEDELLKHTHPMAWIRYRYIVGTVLTNISDSSQERKDILITSLVNMIMGFEGQVLNISDMTKKMFAGAHTLKGTQHLMLLYNSWNEVADKLEKYTYDELTRVIPMEITAEELSIVDINGNMIL